MDDSPQPESAPAGTAQPKEPLTLPADAHRKFSYGTFFGGVAAGCGVSVLLVILLAAGLGYMGKKMAESMGDGISVLGAPKFPSHDKLTAYGEPDPDWTFEKLEGGEMKLADLRGKVVLLNFWATWCGPCVSEMPSIQKLAHEVAQEPIVVIPVSDEDTDTVRRFMRSKQYSFAVYTYKGMLPAVFRTDGIPATFVLTPQGTVVFRHVGASNWSSEACATFLRSLIRKAQEETPKPKTGSN